MAFLSIAWGFVTSPIGRYLLGIVLVACMFLGTYWKGHASGWDERDKQAEIQAAQEAKATTALLSQRVKVTTVEVVKYRDRVQVITKEVPRVEELEKEVAATGPIVLPGAYRRLHDFAATGQLSVDPSGAASPADPVEAVALAQACADNYVSARINAARLEAFQSWATEQSKLNPRKASP